MKSPFDIFRVRDLPSWLHPEIRNSLAHLEGMTWEQALRTSPDRVIAHGGVPLAGHLLQLAMEIAPRATLIHLAQRIRDEDVIALAEVEPALALEVAPERLPYAMREAFAHQHPATAFIHAWPFLAEAARKHVGETVEQDEPDLFCLYLGRTTDPDAHKDIAGRMAARNKQRIGGDEDPDAPPDVIDWSPLAISLDDAGIEALATVDPWIPMSMMPHRLTADTRARILARRPWLVLGPAAMFADEGLVTVMAARHPRRAIGCHGCLPRKALDAIARSGFCTPAMFKALAGGRRGDTRT